MTLFHLLLGIDMEQGVLLVEPAMPSIGRLVAEKGSVVWWNETGSDGSWTRMASRGPQPGFLAPGLHRSSPRPTTCRAGPGWQIAIGPQAGRTGRMVVPELVGAALTEGLAGLGTGPGREPGGEVQSRRRWRTAPTTAPGHGSRAASSQNPCCAPGTAPCAQSGSL